jgi:hypothetical protein
VSVDEQPEPSNVSSHVFEISRLLGDPGAVVDRCHRHVLREWHLGIVRSQTTLPLRIGHPTFLGLGLVGGRLAWGVAR